MSKKQKRMLFRIRLSAVLLLDAVLLPLSDFPLLRLAVFLVPYGVIGWDVWGFVLEGRRGWSGCGSSQGASSHPRSDPSPSAALPALGPFSEKGLHMESSNHRIAQVGKDLKDR